MNISKLCVLVCSLIATGAWAGQPGENTHGSTTISISDNLAGADACLAMTSAADLDDDIAISSSALAEAMSAASSYIDVTYAGDVNVDLTRHGNNGAVHQVALNTSMGSGSIFVQMASAGTDVESYATAYSSAEAQAAAEMIGHALAVATTGIDESGEFLGIDITIKIVLELALEAMAQSQASSESTAVAESESGTTAESAASSSASGGGVSMNGSTFYVQGANIEQFDTQLSAASGSVLNVQTDALAEVYASAMVVSIVHTLAEASAQAQASSQLTFSYDLPLIGSGSIPIVADQDSGSQAALQIMNAAEEIVAYAQAAANSSASALAGSAVSMDVAVHFENLPGTEDLLEITSTGNLQLDCTNVLSSANAEADADTDE